MPRTTKDPVIGKTYGTWRVVSLGPRNSYRNKRWNCKCVECDHEKLTAKREIIICRQCRTCSGRWSTHVLGHTWYSMIHRCHVVHSTSYFWYGARGIAVYPPWRKSFPLFASYIEETLGPRPKGKTLDRIDNDGNYCPGNLKWSTSKEQTRNTRRSLWVAYKGQTKCLAAWVEETGIPRSTLVSRLESGWTPAAAFTTPVQHQTTLTVRQARQIRGAYRKDATQTKLAKKYGVSRATISNIVYNKTHKEA